MGTSRTTLATIGICSFLFLATFWEQVQCRYPTGRYQTSRRRNSIVFPVEEEVRCVTDLGWPGECIDVRACRGAKRAIAAGNHPIRCGWSNHYTPMVCCHPDQIIGRQEPDVVVYPNANWNAIQPEPEKQHRRFENRRRFRSSTRRPDFVGRQT